MCSYLSERQEVVANLMEGKIRMQSEASEKFFEKIFEELQELEEQKSKEALVLVQNKHKLIMGRRKGKSENAAKVGGVESNRGEI